MDGNAAASLLYDAFGAEMTAVLFTCAGCGAVHPLAEARVYRSVGAVLRCPRCHHIVVTVVRVRDRYVVDALGSNDLRPAR